MQNSNCLNLNPIMMNSIWNLLEKLKKFFFLNMDSWNPIDGFFAENILSKMWKKIFIIMSSRLVFLSLFSDFLTKSLVLMDQWACFITIRNSFYGFELNNLSIIYLLPQISVILKKVPRGSGWPLITTMMTPTLRAAAQKRKKIKVRYNR